MAAMVRRAGEVLVDLDELREIQCRARARQGLDPETGLRVSDKAEAHLDSVTHPESEPPRESPTQRVVESSAQTSQPPRRPKTTCEVVETPETPKGVTAGPVTDGMSPDPESPDPEHRTRWRHEPDAELIARLERQDLDDQERVELALQYQYQVLGGELPADGDERGSLLFDFARAMLAASSWRELDQAEFATGVARLLIAWDKWAESAVDLTDGTVDPEDLDNLEELFYDAWHFVKCPLGFEPVEFARKLAAAHPLTAASGCPIAERLRRYGDALSMLAWLDVVTVDSDAFIGERTLGNALGVKRGAARGHLRRAIRDQWVIVTTEGTKRRARRYRFEFNRLNDGWRAKAAKTAAEFIGEPWASRQGLSGDGPPATSLKTDETHKRDVNEGNEER